MKNLSKYHRIFTILGSVCILYWLFLFILYGNITFSVAFLLFGIALLCYVGIERYFHICIWKKLPKFLQKLVGSILLIGCLSFCVIETRIVYDGLVSASSYGDTILVLGAGLHGDIISTSLKHRLDKAVEVHKKNPDQMILVSGGQGVNETISEASAMKAYLITQGIDASLIIMEDQSSNTSENFQFSKAILELQPNPSMHITLISNGFHMHRATFIGEREGFHISGAPAKGMWATNPCFYVREFFGVVRAYLFGF